MILQLTQSLVAIKYGIDCAIILSHIKYWVDKNKANDTNFHDGKYWTYNSHEAFAKLFPCFTEKQIRRILDKLKSSNLVLTGNYGTGSNRTLWYTVTEKAEKELANFEVEDEGSCSDEPEKQDQLTDEETNTFSSENCENEDVSNPISNAQTSTFICPNGQIQMPKRAPNINKPKENTKLKEKETHKEKDKTWESSDSVCEELCAFWNERAVIKCDEITKGIRHAILLHLKEHSIEQIKQAMTRHFDIRDDEEYYETFTWGLKAFISSAKAMPMYMDDGEKWLRYKHAKKSKQGMFIHNNYTKEQIQGLISNLDETEL